MIRVWVVRHADPNIWVPRTHHPDDIAEEIADSAVPMGGGVRVEQHNGHKPLLYIRYPHGGEEVVLGVAGV